MLKLAFVHIIFIIHNESNKHLISLISSFIRIRIIPVSNLGPPSANQRNAILMAFRWWASGGPLLYAYRDDKVQFAHI